MPPASLVSRPQMRGSRDIGRGTTGTMTESPANRGSSVDRRAELSFLSTTTVFATALDISLSELTIESFFPADPATAEAMRRLAEALGDGMKPGS